MTHSDDNGLVLPPKFGSSSSGHRFPFTKGKNSKKKLLKWQKRSRPAWKKKNIRVKFDNREISLNLVLSSNEYELKGVPLRIAIGPKDLEKKSVEIARRDTLSKNIVSQQEVLNYVENQLEEMQHALFDKAKRFRGGKHYRSRDL